MRPDNDQAKMLDPMETNIPFNNEYLGKKKLPNVPFLTHDFPNGTSDVPQEHLMLVTKGQLDKM